jgi:hypothetical protein
MYDRFGSDAANQMGGDNFQGNPFAGGGFGGFGGFGNGGFHVHVITITVFFFLLILQYFLLYLSI